MEEKTIPRHVAIIPDGNRRWAKERGLPTILGHKQGVEQSKKLIRSAMEAGVEVLTFFGFSTENWQRAPDEVKYLLDLYERFARKEARDLASQGVQFRAYGQLERFPQSLQTALAETMALTKENTKFVLNICLSYGGRDDLVRAIQKIVASGIRHENITEDLVSQSVDLADLPSPDLIIRTSGEQRLSGFLTWQSVYSELYFTDSNFPDFGKEEFLAALAEYELRQRRYGK